MKTLFHNSGALLYCDEEGKTIGSTDVFDRVQTARNHFEEVGLASRLCNAIYTIIHLGTSIF